jgi:hypothetical protein
MNYPLETFLDDYQAWLKQDRVSVASLPPDRSISLLKDSFVSRYPESDKSDEYCRNFRRVMRLLWSAPSSLYEAGLLEKHPATHAGKFPASLLYAAHKLVIEQGIEQPTLEEISDAAKRYEQSAYRDS